MADTAQFYRQAFTSAFEGEINLKSGSSPSVKVTLHTASYTPNKDTHRYYDVSVNNEIAGTGYTTGGVAVTSPAIAYDGTTAVKMTGGNVSLPSNTTAARYAVVRYDNPASNKPLLTYVDFGADKVVTSITWNAAGIAQVTFA